MKMPQNVQIVQKNLYFYIEEGIIVGNVVMYFVQSNFCLKKKQNF
jgi:hypothetical protein